MGCDTIELNLLLSSGLPGEILEWGGQDFDQTLKLGFWDNDINNRSTTTKTQQKQQQQQQE